MRRAAQARRNWGFGSTTYSAALGRTVSSEGERKKLLAEKRRADKKDALQERRDRMAEKKLRAQERAVDAKIAAADRKIDSAEAKLETAEKRVSKGALTEAGFDAIKRHMEKEIERQEDHKKSVMAKNPSFGYGVYQGGGFGETQVKHFKSKSAAETWARSTGLRGYQIKRAFEKVNRGGSGRKSSKRTKKPAGRSNPKAITYTRVSKIAASDKRPGMTHEFFEKRGNSILRRFAGSKAEMTDLRRRAASKNPTSHMRPPSMNGRRNAAGAGRGGAAKGAGAGGAGGGAGAGSQGGRSSTDVRSPTKTSTSTEAETTGNITVTGGAGAGATTTVKIAKSNPLFKKLNALVRKKRGGSGRKPAKRTKKPAGRSNGKRNCKNRRNPAEDAQALSQKFHGRPTTSVKVVNEKLHVHKHLTELGDLVRLVIDTPTGLVAVLNFNTSDPRKVVKLATSEKDPKTGKLVGKQLYLRGGDQEVNLAGLKMDTPLWIRDLMELGRLHEFKKGEPPLMVGGERVKGSITYRTRKGMDDFKLVDYWHKAGEETARKAGPAARSLVLYDYVNKRIQFAGGQYAVRDVGIVN